MALDHIKKCAYVYWKRLDNKEHISAHEVSLIGKELLAEALKHIYEIELRKEDIGKGKFGKPYLIRYPEIQYNISHSGEYVVCVVSDVPVGIDIQEKKMLDFDKLGRKVFTDEEYEKFLKSEEKQDVFFRQWVRIESYLKRTGEGFTRNLKNLRMDGWYQFLNFNSSYDCAICAQEPLHIYMRKM